MCGIAGVLGEADPTHAKAMIHALRHRGPDEAGIHSQGLAHLGATRLAIVDSQPVAQPIAGADSKSWIAFNGEIYNHRELRRELQADGAVFSSTTDTEVVVQLFDRMGEHCLRELRGMFAFAILRGQRFFLARDRYGIKPLHYAHVPDRSMFLFASEAKALLRCRWISPALNVRALVDSVVMRHAYGSKTFFEAIHCLPPGHVMECSYEAELRLEAPRRYFMRDWSAWKPIEIAEADTILEGVLSDAVKRHLDADTEVGITLSGGLDSTVMALLAKEQRDEPLSTFTVADHLEHSDAVQARHVAARLGSKHHTHLLSFGEYLRRIPALIAAEEQPSSLTSMPYFALCNYMSAHVKACLHGEGADELFGGYPEFLQQRGRRLGHFLCNLVLTKRLGATVSDLALGEIIRLSSARSASDYLLRLFEVNMTDQLQRLHLDPVDRLAMSASIEARVPYLDDRVVELVASLPVELRVRQEIGVQKYLLKRWALRRFGEQVFDVVLREKLGVPSAGMRLLKQFDDLCEAALPRDYLDRHEMGAAFATKRQLLIFEIFCAIFQENRGTPIDSVLDFIDARAHDRGAVKAVRSQIA